MNENESAPNKNDFDVSSPEYITVANHRLSRLIRFISRFTTYPCKKFVNSVLREK